MNSFSFKKAFSSIEDLPEEILRLLEHSTGLIVDSEFANFFNEQTFEPVDLTQMQKDWTDPNRGRRRSPRYEVRVTALICNHHKAFRTKTLDVSLTGLKLKDLLPEEFSQGFFDIMLIEENLDEKTYIVFRGRAVAEGKLRTSRVMFDYLAPNSATQLLRLVEGLIPIEYKVAS